jgi:hypothetical protein
MEDRQMDRIRWKKNDRGVRRRMPASYIMANDPHAAQAFTVMRQRGLSHRDAADTIERVFESAFRDALIHDRDKRPECWMLASEGLPLEKIFPDVRGRPTVN